MANEFSNTFLGWAAGGGSTPAEVTDSIMIGAGTDATDSHQVVIGTDTIEEVRFFGQPFLAFDNSLNNLGIGPRSGSVQTLRGSLNGYNMAIGVDALQSQIDEGELPTGTNLAIGINALKVATKPNGSVAVGHRSMETADTPTDCTAVGQRTLRYMTTGTGGTAVGFRAVEHSPFAANTTAIGDSALWSLGNTPGTLEEDISGNTAMGYVVAEYLVTGKQNCFYGRGAGFNMGSGDSNVIIGEGAVSGTGPSDSINLNSVVAIGRKSMNLATGDESVAVGMNTLIAATGGRHTAIGTSAGSIMSTGMGGIFIGWGAGSGAAQLPTANNVIVIGYNAQATAANQVVIGNASSEDFTFGGVTFTQAQLAALKALV